MEFSFTSIGGGSRFLGGLLLDHVEANIQGKLFRCPFLVLICYHNSIYMSIAKKKIVGNPTIYFFDSISLISSSSDLSERKSGAENGSFFFVISSQPIQNFFFVFRLNASAVKVFHIFRLRKILSL